VKFTLKFSDLIILLFYLIVFYFKMVKKRKSLLLKKQDEHSCNRKENLVILSQFHYPPPMDICMMLFFFLDVQDLLSICQLNKTWYSFCKTSKEFNKIWWNLCVSGWYEEGEKPSMNRKDYKRDWKEIYLRNTPQEAVLIKRRDDKKRTKNTLNYLAWETENQYKTKDQLRQYYKTFRSKPKGKRAERNPIDQTDWYFIGDNLEV